MSEIPPPTVPPATPPPPGGGSYTPPGGSYTPPPPPPPPPTGGPVGPANTDRTIWLVLSYLGILSLIPFFAKKDDPEVQWHAKNGVVLFGVEVVWVIIRIAMSRIPMLGCGMAVVGCVVWLGFLALSIYCIVQAVSGKRFRIPVITDIAEKL